MRIDMKASWAEAIDEEVSMMSAGLHICKNLIQGY